MVSLVMTTGRVDLSPLVIFVNDQVIMLSILLLVGLSLAAALRPIDLAMRRLKVDRDDAGETASHTSRAQPTRGKEGLLASRSIR